MIATESPKQGFSEKNLEHFVENEKEVLKLPTLRVFNFRSSQWKAPLDNNTF